MHSHESLAGSLNLWRVILGENGQLHPTAATHSALAPLLALLLEGTTFKKRIEPAPGLTAYVLETGGRSVAVFAPKPGAIATWTPPEYSPA